MDLLHKSYFQFSLICSCNVRTECMIYVTNPNFNTLLAVKQPWLIKYQMLRYLMGYPQKNFRYLGPSMWFSNRISWIISEVQASKNFFFIFLASKKLLAPLRSRIGTGSVFCHSPGVIYKWICIAISSFTMIRENTFGCTESGVLEAKKCSKHYSFNLSFLGNFCNIFSKQALKRRRILGRVSLTDMS